MTVVVVIFGEVLPKTYAINRPDQPALTVAPAVRGVIWLFTPLSATVQPLVSVVLRLCGVSVAAGLGHDQRDAELRGLVEMHARSEARRVGNACGSTCSARRTPY